MTTEEIEDAQEEYNKLITLAKERRLRWEPFKYEQHHILPKCMGGTDDKENLVLLRIKEHHKAHVLLSRMHPDDARLARANLAFNVSSKGAVKDQEEDFEVARLIAAEKISKIHKGRKKSEMEIENIRQARLTAAPRKFSDEAKANMAAARKKTWEERRANGTDKLIAAKVVAVRKANGSYIMSEAQKKQVSEFHKGRIPWNKGKKGAITEETRAKMSESQKRYRRNKTGIKVEESTQTKES